MSTAIELDLDELTPKQLRKLLRATALSEKPHHVREKMKKEDKAKGDEPDDEEDEELEDEDKEHEDLVDLMNEDSEGDGAPKVTEEDMPKGVKFAKKDKKGK